VQAKKWPKMEVFWIVLNKVEPAKQMILNDQKKDDCGDVFSLFSCIFVRLFSVTILMRV
jgi:hypothetical protein